MKTSTLSFREFHEGKNLAKRKQKRSTTKQNYIFQECMWIN